MNAPNAKIAEQLWLRAHESIRRGELASAVRDLAKAFEILKALQDPRLAQVHARWVDVHKMYKEEAGGGATTRTAQKAEAPRTLQAQAEAAANEGALSRAIALYERIVTESPENELAKERLAELRQAVARANALSHPPRAAQPAAAQPVAAQPAVAQPAVAQQPVAQPAVAQQPIAQPVVAQQPIAQPVVAQPVVAQSVVAQPVVAQQPIAQPAAAAPVDDVEFLEALLAQVHARAQERHAS